MTTLAAAAPTASPSNRILIMASVMLGAVMTQLDMTIANVALPHMAGSVSASTEQIAWVLTSYLVSAAIMTPVTGWLAARLGRKRLLILTISGFIISSVLCGVSQSITQLVIFRALQGMFAAPMQPLSQAITLDLFTVAERGMAMAAWSMCMTLGPICGPIIGGWLTETLDWRWIFYINLPLGLLSLLGVLTFMASGDKQQPQPFGFVGFALLSIAMAAAQFMFDRGQGQGWFGSTEIIIYAVIALVAFWFFVIDTATSKRPFLTVRMFADQNFTIALIIGFVAPAAILSVSAIVPLMLQNLYGFPPVMTGLIAGTRGIGSATCLLLMGRLVGKFDNRLLLGGGLVLFAATFYWMVHFTLDTSAEELAFVGVLQGAGMGMVYLPMVTVAFTTLDASIRPEAAGVLALARNLGGSMGISIVLSIVANLAVSARNTLVTPYSLDNAVAQSGALPSQFSLTDPLGVEMLSSAIDRQASMVAYSQLFFVMCITVIAVAPLLMLLRGPKAGSAPPEAAAVE